MIDLPTVSPDVIVGEINLQTGDLVAGDSIYFACTSRADCCSKMNIPITNFDIHRITSHGYEVDQIVKSLSPAIINPGTPENQKQSAYFLKSKPYDRTCTFLEDNLCKIHEYKPFACRIYPFTLEFLDENRVNILINKFQICQSITNAKENSSNNLSILSEIYYLLKTEIELREKFAQNPHISE